MLTAIRSTIASLDGRTCAIACACLVAFAGKTVLAQGAIVTPAGNAVEASALAVDESRSVEIHVEATPAVNPVRIRLIGDEGITLHLRNERATNAGTVAREWAAMCTAPCAVEVLPGIHEFGLSPENARLGGFSVSSVGNVFVPAAGLMLRGEIDRRSDRRILGTILAIASLALGVVGFASLVSLTGERNKAAASGIATASVLTILVGGLVGLGFAFSGDDAHVELVPGDPADAE